MNLNILFVLCMILFHVYNHLINVCNENTIFCLNVCPVPCPPCHPFMRSEFRPRVKSHSIDLTCTLKVIILSVCVNILLLLSIETKYRFVPFNTPTNILISAQKSSILTYRNMILPILLLSYLTIFDYYLIILLPCQFFKVNLDIKARVKRSFAFVKGFHCCTANITISVCYRLSCINYINLTYFSYHPHETLAVWWFVLRIILSSNIHPNPGPVHLNNSFSGGFLSFCNWNLNTLSKDDFYRITLQKPTI